jgi:hypothetical protein
MATNLVKVVSAEAALELRFGLLTSNRLFKNPTLTQGENPKALAAKAKEVRLILIL